MKNRLTSLLLLALTGCVSGAKVRADADVLRQEVERARRSGAMRCAPRELASAEANIDFAIAELREGTSYRGSQHINDAKVAIRQALELSKDCGPKQVLIQEKDPELKPPPLVVRIEETDRDGDGIPDKDDLCADAAEDRDGFKDDDGCLDADNDEDGVLDGNDKCPLLPGPLTNQGCPEDTGKDRDADGVPDVKDQCIDSVEDKDGFQDEDGCPDPDNDNDGVLDTSDKCPDVTGPIQNVGCPITDKDGDGAQDDADKCPDEPEDKDGFQDEDGCPDLDNDNDGLPDAQDKCPAEPGPTENIGCPDQDKDADGLIDRLDKCPEQKGVAENTGCPDVDKDEDGVADRLDKCPEQKGVTETEGCPDPDQDEDGIVDRLDKCPADYGPSTSNGCPKKYKRVVVKKDRIEIKQQILFKSGSGRITGRNSFYIIADVAEALKDNPQLKKVRIEGHTDSVGSDSLNLRLSQLRADAVMAELVKRGIDPSRLEAVGFGEAQPIASNSTRSGRAQNRRTEFNILEQ